MYLLFFLLFILFCLLLFLSCKSCPLSKLTLRAKMFSFKNVSSCKKVFVQKCPFCSILTLQEKFLRAYLQSLMFTKFALSYFDAFLKNLKVFMFIRESEKKYFFLINFFLSIFYIIFEKRYN